VVGKETRHAYRLFAAQEEQGEQGQEFLALLIKREQELLAYDEAFINAYKNHGQSAKTLHNLSMEYDHTLKK
jgi:hypothetical protein